MVVEVLRGDELQDSVAEVLESLVVTRRDGWILIRERAVRDGLEKESGVAKVNPDFLLELLQRL
jgi:hypothetical protein